MGLWEMMFSGEPEPLAVSDGLANEAEMPPSQPLEDGLESEERMAKMLALVIVGFVLLGLFLTVWNWGWPKIKALWGYVLPWFLMYIVARSTERFLSAYLFEALRSWYAALSLIFGWVCWPLPDSIC